MPNTHESDYEKRKKLEMPPYKGIDMYFPTSQQGCIVYPLFCLFENVVPNYHINLTFWSAHSFLVNSNIIDRGVPIYFYVDRRLWDLTSQQFEDAGIPEPMVILFDLPERKWNGHWFMPKMNIVLDDRFDDYENVILPDGDLFLASRHNLTDESRKMFDIRLLWNRVDRSLFATSHISPDIRHPLNYHMYTELSEEESNQICAEWLKENFGFKVRSVHKSRAYLNAFCPKNLNHNYREFIRKCMPYFGDDEAVNSLYMQYTNKKLEDLIETWGIPVAENSSQMMDYQAAHEFFFMHIQRGAMNRRRIPTWRHLMGQFK